MLKKVWEVKFDRKHGKDTDKVVQYFANMHDAYTWATRNIDSYKKYHPCLDENLIYSIKEKWIFKKNLTIWNYSPYIKWD